MEYENIYEFDKNQTYIRLKSEIESERIKGLLELVHSETSYEDSLRYSIGFTKSNNEWEVGCGIECFGLLARIHEKLDIDKVKAILIESLKSESQVIRGKCEDAISDIEVFLGIKIE